jgi:hypothetical protein
MLAHRTINPPSPVVATHSDGRFMQFSSLGAAARWIVETNPNMSLKVDASTVSRKVRNGQPIEGWSFKYQTDTEVAKKTTVQIESDSSDPIAFVFGPEAGELFKDKSVRVTNEKPCGVSVLDVIKVICDVQNPSDVFHTLCAQHAEFREKIYEQLTRGRPTPVTNVQGLVTLINLLPGANAAKFRAGAAKLLVRFMGGDISLIQELQVINQAHASGATLGTISALAAESVSTLPPVLPSNNKYAFLSPSMSGKDMHDFAGKEVCYLLTFPLDTNKSYIKFGRTTNLHNRMTEHMREIPGMQIWFVLETPHARKLEDMFKKKMKYGGYLIDVVVKDKKQTEIITNITTEEAEDVLVSLHDAMIGSDDEESHKGKIIKMEIDVRKKELDLEMERIKTHAAIEQDKLRIINMYLQQANTIVPPDILLQLLRSNK